MEPIRTTPRPSRRRVLGGLGAGSLAVALSPALASCGSGSEQKVSRAEDATLPTYKERTDIETKPDLAPTDEGVPGAYFAYPHPAFQSVKEKPLDGQTISAMSLLFGATPNPRAENTAWQLVEEMLGGTIDVNGVGSSDYAAKINTTLASGQLPDIMVDDGDAIKDIVPFLENSCVDIGEYIGGDKVADYPNLQAIPQIFWEQGVENGKLYGIPIPRNITAGLGVVNTGLLKERTGASSTSEFRDLQDFENAAKELTNAGADHWAFGSTKFGLQTFMPLFKVPFGWQLEGDKLVASTETPQYIEALEFVKKLADAGYMVPGSDGWTKSQMRDAFVSGRTAIIYDGLPGMLGGNGYMNTVPRSNPAGTVEPFQLFAGAKPNADNITVVRSVITNGDGSKERVEAILRFVSFLAAPFGSQEHLAINYGKEGDDYNFAPDGSLALTDRGANNVAVPWRYLGSPTNTLFDPANRGAVETVHKAYESSVPEAQQNPVASVYSPTAASRGAELSQPVTDSIQNDLTGRGTLDQVKTAIKTWASSGGVDIRKELLEGLNGAPSDG